MTSATIRAPDFLSRMALIVNVDVRLAAVGKGANTSVYCSPCRICMTFWERLLVLLKSIDNVLLLVQDEIQANCRNLKWIIFLISLKKSVCLCVWSGNISCFQLHYKNSNILSKSNATWQPWGGVGVSGVWNSRFQKGKKNGSHPGADRMGDTKCTLRSKSGLSGQCGLYSELSLWAKWAAVKEEHHKKVS